jgi:hypothetical protein
MDDPLYLNGRLDEPLEAFFQLMVIYTHLEDHIEEPLEMLLVSSFSDSPDSAGFFKLERFSLFT